MTEKEKAIINKFLEQEPNKPSKNFTKLALLETANKQYELLNLLRKFWLGTITNGLANYQRDSQVTLGLKAFSKSENKIDYDEINDFCESIGWENIINLQWDTPHLTIYYLRK